MLPGKCIHCRLTTSAARIARWALTQDCQYIALSNDAFYFFHDFYLKYHEKYHNILNNKVIEF